MRILLLLLLVASVRAADISLVNIGTAANDGTGDSLRTAFGKINTNFSNLNTAVGSAGAINPTDSYIPVRSNSTTFANSPWYLTDSDAMGFGGGGAYSFVLNTTNILVGRRAVYTVNSSANANTAFGNTALGALTSGQNNSAAGRSALAVLTSGGANTAVGANAGASITTSDNGTFLGSSAGTVATGADNTAIGSAASSTLTTGARNTTIGSQVAYNNKGSDGVSVGYQAGVVASNLTRAIVIGSQPLNGAERTDKDLQGTIHIGYKSSSLTNNVQAVTNSVYIGDGLLPAASNTIIVGNTNQTSAKFAIASNDGSSSKFLSADGTYRIPFVSYSGATKALVDSTDVSLFRTALASGKYAHIKVRFNITVKNASEAQFEVDEVWFSLYNEAGTFDSFFTYGNFFGSSRLTTGTLTVNSLAQASTSTTHDLKINVTTSLTSLTTFTVSWFVVDYVTDDTNLTFTAL